MSDVHYMSHALSLGVRGLGKTWPNPAVGCVIVAKGRIVGRGWTQEGGRPHAEVMALTQAGPLARGAAVYVTLEPCSHYGKTPPCASALIDAGVSRVVIALGDPDPRVNGQGIVMLRAAGIEVTTGVCEAQAQADQLGFLMRVTLRRPMVTLKLATSWDGRIATSTGESQWITGPRSRRRVHAMRANHDAVMIGAGTARSDDPSLIVRGFGVEKQPVRVVLSQALDLPLTGQLAMTAKDVPLWILHGPNAQQELRHVWQDIGARLFEVPVHQGQLDLEAVLNVLGEQGLTRVFCEGGGVLAAGLLKADLADRVAVFTAGLGLGAEGLPALGPMGLRRLAEAPRFEAMSTEKIGPDTLTFWQRNLAI